MKSSLIGHLDLHVLRERPAGGGGVHNVADLPPQDLLLVPLRPVVHEDAAGAEATGAASLGNTVQVLALLGSVANTFRGKYFRNTTSAFITTLCSN